MRKERETKQVSSVATANSLDNIKYRYQITAAEYQIGNPINCW